MVAHKNWGCMSNAQQHFYTLRIASDIRDIHQTWDNALASPLPIDMSNLRIFWSCLMYNKYRTDGGGTRPIVILFCLLISHLIASDRETVPEATVIEVELEAIIGNYKMLIFYNGMEKGDSVCTPRFVDNAATWCLFWKGLSVVGSTCQLTLGRPGERWCSCHVSVYKVIKNRKKIRHGLFSLDATPNQL